MCPRTLAPVLFLLALPCAAGAAEPQRAASAVRENPGELPSEASVWAAALESDDPLIRSQTKGFMDTAYTAIKAGITKEEESEIAEFYGLLKGLASTCPETRRRSRASILARRWFQYLNLKDPLRPADGGTSEERERRGNEVVEFDSCMKDLADADPEIRERAQESLIEHFQAFRFEVELAKAAAVSMEVRTRLIEILESWARKEKYHRYLARPLSSCDSVRNTVYPARLRSYAAPAPRAQSAQEGRNIFQINGTGTVGRQQERVQEAVPQMDNDSQVLWISSE